MKKNISKILIGVSVLLFILFLVFSIIDWNNYNEFMSAPFYTYIIIRGLEFLLPMLICIGINLTLKKKSGK